MSIFSRYILDLSPERVQFGGVNAVHMWMFKVFKKNIVLIFVVVELQHFTSFNDIPPVSMAQREIEMKVIRLCPSPQVHLSIIWSPQTFLVLQ